MFLSEQLPYKRLMKTMGSSVLSASVGLLLCGGFGNEGWIPINKNLWSLSYVLITSGLAWLVLSCFYFLIDVKNYWLGVSLVEPGSNSILLYVGHEIASSILPFHFSVGNTHFGHLGENLWGALLWVLISVYLYKKNMLWVV
jgi:heparan-alpha-glucosaminide N-acetyltransferase